MILKRRIRFGVTMMCATLLATSCGGSSTPTTSTPDTTTEASSSVAPSTAIASGTAAVTSADPVPSEVPSEAPLTSAETATGTETVVSGEPVTNGEPTKTTEGVAPAVDLSSCALGPVAAAGEVTFVRDGALLSFDGTTTRCLVKQLDGPADRITWNPTGTTALINGDKALTANGAQRATGFLGPNATVRWSYPTGRNLIGIAKNGELAKRNPDTLKRTVLRSEMLRVDEVAYQPAGTSVTVVGQIQEGPDAKAEGIYSMPNVGGSIQQLVINETAERTWNLQYDKTGTQLFFLAKHRAGGDYTQETFHVHRLNRDPELEGDADALTELITLTASPLDHLVVSEYDENLGAVRVGYCRAGAIKVFGEGTDTFDVSSRASLDPVGWLPGGKLIVAQRAQGTPCDAPVTLAMWTAADGLTELNVGKVTVPAIRAVRGTAQDIAGFARAPEA
jgi:hypothetical protein